MLDGKKGIKEELDRLFSRLLDAFSVYYDVKRENAAAPFDAEARFSSRQEQYFLLRSLKLSEAESREIVYFAKRERLERAELLRLDGLAWERGLSEARPGPAHRNTDVALWVMAGTVDGDARSQVRSCTHSRLYRFGLWGFSNYRLAVVEHAAGAAFFNRQGKIWKPLAADLLGRQGE